MFGSFVAFVQNATLLQINRELLRNERLDGGPFNTLFVIKFKKLFSFLWLSILQLQYSGAIKVF